MRLRQRQQRGTEGALAPDYAEPIVAWRLWSVVGDGHVLLRSLFHPMLWPPRRPLAAACERWRPVARLLDRRHEPPNDRCSCGIYAADLDVIADYLEEPPGIGVEALPRVVGLVSLWGSVLECEHGWRASRAYPAAIFVPTYSFRPGSRPTPEETALALRAYGVPVEVAVASRPDELIRELGREPYPVSHVSTGGAQ